MVNPCWLEHDSGFILNQWDPTVVFHGMGGIQVLCAGHCWWTKEVLSESSRLKLDLRSLSSIHVHMMMWMMWMFTRNPAFDHFLELDDVLDDVNRCQSQFFAIKISGFWMWHELGNLPWVVSIRKLKVDKLSADIKPEESKVRVEVRALRVPKSSEMVKFEVLMKGAGEVWIPILQNHPISTYGNGSKWKT